jgi:DNA-binding NarL/FixJ family response regulator
VGSQKCRETRRLIARSYQVHPKVFVFFDRLTNTKRFEVKAGPDGSLPVEQAISLLAMQCVVRGQSPGDFRVLVSTGENLLDGLMPRTKKLIQHCMATVLPIHISQRQQEVLRGILQNHSNKEIAGTLNVAERTVKFHVSALLQKFHVQGRVGLMQKASDMLSLEKIPPQDVPSVLAPVAVPRSPRPNGSSLPPKLLQLAASERRTR